MIHYFNSPQQTVLTKKSPSSEYFLQTPVKVTPSLNPYYSNRLNYYKAKYIGWLMIHSPIRLTDHMF